MATGDGLITAKMRKIGAKRQLADGCRIEKRASALDAR
jgi:hypothetical protein